MRTGKASDRIQRLVDALPLEPGMRVLEIGCGTGAAARAVLQRIGAGHVLGIDRSAKAIELAGRASATMVSEGRLSLIRGSVETLELPPHSVPFDLAYAFRVGALDGRHPELEQAALASIRRVLHRSGVLYIDQGNSVQKKPVH